jgi:hypothetical protein
LLQHSAFFSQSAALSHSAHLAASHGAVASEHSAALSQSAHLLSQHSVFVSHEPAHSVFLLLQHEHEAIANITATAAIEIKIFFITDYFKLNLFHYRKSNKFESNLQYF